MDLVVRIGPRSTRARETKASNYLAVRINFMDLQVAYLADAQEVNQLRTHFSVVATVTFFTDELYATLPYLLFLRLLLAFAFACAYQS